MQSIKDIVHSGYGEYLSKTSHKDQLIDIFLICVFLSGSIQFMYMVIVGNFPFNSFLGGLFSCVGLFVLTLNLKLSQEQNISGNTFSFRNVGDYIICAFLLFIVTINFIG